MLNGASYYIMRIVFSILLLFHDGFFIFCSGTGTALMMNTYESLHVCFLFRGFIFSVLVESLFYRSASNSFCSLKKNNVEEEGEEQQRR